MDQADHSTVPATRDGELELMQATAAGRRLGAAMVVLLIAGLAGFWWLILPWIQSAFGPLPSSEAIERIKIGFAILALIVTALAAVLAATGQRILRSRQAPPPGALLWRDTQIVRGDRARRTGIAYCVTGLLCAALGIGLGVTIWSMLDRVSASMSITLPPGVTILKQTLPEPK